MTDFVIPFESQNKNGTISVISYVLLRRTRSKKPSVTSKRRILVSLTFLSLSDVGTAQLVEQSEENFNNASTIIGGAFKSDLRAVEEVESYCIGNKTTNMTRLAITSFLPRIESEKNYVSRDSSCCGWFNGSGRRTLSS
jgi:hypothetical protein